MLFLYFLMFLICILITRSVFRINAIVGRLDSIVKGQNRIIELIDPRKEKGSDEPVLPPKPIQAEKPRTFMEGIRRGLKH